MAHKKSPLDAAREADGFKPRKKPKPKSRKTAKPRVSAAERDRLVRADERKKVLERVNRVSRRQQDRNFKRFTKESQFPKKTKFFSGLGVFKRTQRLRESIGNFSEQARQQFFGRSNARKVVKSLVESSQISRVRLRRFGAVTGLLALGALIARDSTGDPIKKRQVGRPRFKRPKGRPKNPNRVGRPRLSTRR